MTYDIKYLVNIYNIYNAIYICVCVSIYSKYLEEIKTLKFAT